ncbi:MAG: hypothetical protein NC935_03805 [Candidatus Omnitrophica bacterium]|nr:hypothetical protein [Candidatus Omnitrophota bacterium]
MIGDKKNFVKSIYYYLVFLISLILIIVGFVGLVNVGLRTFFFKEADKPLIYPIPKPPEAKISDKEFENQLKQQLEFEKQQKIVSRQQKIVDSLTLLIVGSIVFVFNWWLNRDRIIND